MKKGFGLSPKTLFAVEERFELSEGETLTRFRGVLLRPLGHSTIASRKSNLSIMPQKNAQRDLNPPRTYLPAVVASIIGITSTSIIITTTVIAIAPTTTPAARSHQLSPSHHKTLRTSHSPHTLPQVQGNSARPSSPHHTTHHIPHTTYHIPLHIRATALSSGNVRLARIACALSPNRPASG